MQEAALFPIVRAVARPLIVEGAANLSSLPGPVLLIANHVSHLDGITLLSALGRPDAKLPPLLPRNGDISERY